MNQKNCPSLEGLLLLTPELSLVSRVTTLLTFRKQFVSFSTVISHQANTFPRSGHAAKYVELEKMNIRILSCIV